MVAEKPSETRYYKHYSTFREKPAKLLIVSLRNGIHKLYRYIETLLMKRWVIQSWIQGFIAFHMEVAAQKDW